ncbi:hypothetical protein ACFXAE_20565 [Streptomyces sp. NPDC059454]|uniref:hypothetical protein n=1 Tax=Streptomyces sp. NPDC059454 TaxID=3346836 RepID=UPI00368F22FE
MASSTPLAAYRITPGEGNLRTLRLDDSLIGLKRWQFQGERAERPTEFGAEWTGDRKGREAEFASDCPGAPVFSRRLAGRLGDQLEKAGRLVPVRVAGTAADDYVLYVVESLVDCLDTRRSSQPKKATGEMKKMVFRPEAYPVDLPAFRVPEFPVAVCWNGWMLDLLKDVVGDDVIGRLLWSPDPAAAPHPDPWGV